MMNGEWRMADGGFYESKISLGKHLFALINSEIFLHVLHEIELAKP